MVSDAKGGDLGGGRPIQYVYIQMQHDTVVWTVPWLYIVKSSPPDLHPRPRSMVEGTEYMRGCREGGGGDSAWQLY